MPAEQFTTKIIVTETRQIYSGRTAAGGSYTIWQLIATKPDGTPITMNLRSFSDLPKHQVLEVECKLFRSQQYGDSYTVERKGEAGDRPQAQQQGGLTLEQRVKRIEDFLSGRGEFRGSAAPEQQQAAPPPTPPPTPPPAPPPAPVVAPDPPMAAPPTDFDF